MFIDFATLKRMAEQSAAVTQACSCHDAQALAWQQMPLTLELDQFEEVGTMVENPYAEATLRNTTPPAPVCKATTPPSRRVTIRPI